MKKTINNQYQWEGANRHGQVLRGELAGANTATIRAKLRKQGIEPKKIRRIAQPFLSGLINSQVTPNDITFFIRQMATMSRAGVPLIQSFEIVAEGCDNLALKKIINEIRDTVSTGSNFSSALRKFNQYFDDLTCNLIEAGEQSGALEEMLERVALYREKTESLQKKVKKAMLYPSITMVVAIIVTIIMLVKVVPTFENMFHGYGAELPTATQFVISLSNIVQDYFIQTLAIFVGSIVILKKFIQHSSNIRRRYDRLILATPIVGELVKKSTVARYARVLSTTLAAGLPLVDALNSVAGAVNNRVFRDAIIRIRNEISSGQQMHFAMRNTQIFPDMIIQMAAIGEESGSLDNMLTKAANYYEDEVDNTVENITTMIEPAMFIFLGLVLGGLLIAMYMPMFQMGDII